MKLDDATIRTLAVPAGQSESTVYDDEVSALGVRIRASGGKSWTVQYRSKGRIRRFVIGPTERVTAKAARARAKQVLAAVTLGDDPAGAKTAERKLAKSSLLATAKEYLEARKPFLRPSSYRVTELYLINPRYFGGLHRTPITEVGLSDIASRLNAITRESGNVTADRARAALHAMFTWCAQQGMLGERPTNPVTATRSPGASVPRDRVLSDDELARIWACASGDDDAGRVIRLLVLLASRRSEVGGLRWSEVKLEAGIWTLPGDRSKNGREHVLPLPDLALQILADVPRVVGRDHVFGARSEIGFCAWNQMKGALDKALGDEVRPWKIHDLRRSAATRMCDLGIAPHVVEEILNHRSGHRRGTASTYNRSSYQREVRAALALWESHIRTLIEGGERKIIALRT